MLTFENLKDFLDEKVLKYNTPEFILDDPIQIPHRYNTKEDIEISGFLAATISWGNRKSIIKSASRMMELMGNAPYDFVMSHDEYQLQQFDGPIHRTFSGTDFRYFIRALKHIYTNHQGLEGLFNRHADATSLQPAICKLKSIFFEIPHPKRTTKHIPDPAKGSAAKRINMWLRWLVRRDQAGVDLGIWRSISPSLLSCPLDVHSGKVARKLGLITRKQNDSKALYELDKNLRKMDPDDPAKYDFALFGLSVFEKF
jgi:uncharacterized protein (TIGR02757 family)